MTIDALYSLFRQYPHVTTDSRNCPQGGIFFALKGDKFDGNRFAAQALSNGCRYAVIDDPAYALHKGMILTENALHTLQALAKHHRAALGVPVIAVTGTNGKTTTKELIAAVMSTTFQTLYTEGNLNNHIGVPLTLLRLKPWHEMAVIEMGASHEGDIRELSAIAQPDYGLITNVGYAHLEGFGSYEKVLATKTELYHYLCQKRKRSLRIAFIRHEDEALRAMAKGLRIIAYGTGDAFVTGKVLSNDPYLTFRWARRGQSPHTVRTQLIGQYNIHNLLAAIAVGAFLRIPTGKINTALEAYVPSNHRSQLLQTSRNTVIMDAYNANPSSMQAALSSFAAMSASPKAVILGDMLELGEGAAVKHAEMVELIRQYGFEQALLCGECFRHTSSSYPSYPQTDELIAALQSHPLRGYHILVKGSHGMALDKILPYI